MRAFWYKHQREDSKLSPLEEGWALSRSAVILIGLWGKTGEELLVRAEVTLFF